MVNSVETFTYVPAYRTFFSFLYQFFVRRLSVKFQGNDARETNKTITKVQPCVHARVLLLFPKTISGNTQFVGNSTEGKT